MNILEKYARRVMEADEVEILEFPFEGLCGLLSDVQDILIAVAEERVSEEHLNRVLEIIGDTEDEKAPF